MLMDYFDRYARLHKPYKGGAWCYEDGCIYRGLETLHRATGEARWMDHIQRMVDAQIGPDLSLSGYDPSEYNIDHVQAGRALLYLHEVTGEARYIGAAKTLIGQLETHPRTRSGVYWHKLRYPWQVWLDGLYMGLPFQIGYGQRTGKGVLVDDALVQLRKALELTYVPETGLYAHAVDEARKQAWADPETGKTRAHWARALGWLCMALVDVADLVGPNRFAPMQRQTSDLLTKIAGLRVQDGLWLQVIDQPDLEGNFQESSASAMFVYALLKAQALGLYDGDAAPLVDHLTARVMRQTAEGTMEMAQICHVAGLGYFGDRYRDGTAEYYVSEHCVPDDAKGVGPMMMVVAQQILHADTRKAALAGQ